MRTRKQVLGVLLGWLAALPLMAAEPDAWAGQHFLADYAKLEPLPKGQGRDYAYVIPDVEKRGVGFGRVMIDQPEVFISPESPYRGAKPADIAAIADVVRATLIDAVQARGYAVVDQPAPDVLYVRVAIADLQIAKKPRKALAYTPIGFVVDAGLKSLEDFMDKYEILDMSLQVEIRDSVQQDVLAAAVMRRGHSAGARKPIPFDTMVATTKDLGERFACRIDNGHVAAGQRIDCSDPAARAARPRLVGEVRP